TFPKNTATSVLPDFEITGFRFGNPRMILWREVHDNVPHLDRLSEALRMRIETKLGLGAFGEFSHRVKNPRLPSIESYVLEDTRGKISSIKDWLKTEGRWLYLHGFQTTGFCAATNGQCVFTPPDWFVREDR